VNTHQHSAWTLPVSKTNAVIQFNEVIVVARHHSPQTSPVQFIADPFSRIERHVLLSQKDRSPSPTYAPVILSSVPGVDHHCRKTPNACRRVRAWRLSAAPQKQNQRKHHRGRPADKSKPFGCKYELRWKH
jgi:hypothetical protein